MSLVQGRLDTSAEPAVGRQIESYLGTVLDGLAERVEFDASTVDSDSTQSIFDLLTNRRYGHLGRTKSERYREDVTGKLLPYVSRNEPVHFYYDLGPGYHASLMPGKSDLSFDVGLGELLALHNVVSFCNDVEKLYEPGARFHLVIDNLCGWATNDIPLNRLEAFVERLRQLIRSVGAEDLVSVLVESENGDQGEYLDRLACVAEAIPDAPPTRDEIENVARFLGRACGSREASLRIERYERTTIVTEAMLADAIRGVRLTQRAGSSTLGFRSFPGGDQRIQVGQVAFSDRRNGGVRPFLLSSRNVDQFHVVELDLATILPHPITRVIWAKRRIAGPS